MTTTTEKYRSDYRCMTTNALIEEAKREPESCVNYRELAWALAEKLEKKQAQLDEHRYGYEADRYDYDTQY